ncbi:MAG: hypothetical protein PHN49_01410 [Candidatus Omnitrophica bacterium]|nr:hypothetical protein [Candidatus Omnitrophota bacterium]MDD5670275.1 hypothetical protein [Candidatus Omnitrophota bacterium]
MKPKGLWLLMVGMLLSVPAGSLSRAQEAESLSIANLAIPKSLGKVEERIPGTTQRWVIEIQDVHSQFTAQENIAAIVDHLNAVYGIKTVALEGGWSETSFPQSWGLPTSREKNMLARALLEDGHIGGPVYAALFSKTPISIIGLEETGPYLENVNLYTEYLKQRDDIKSQLDQLSKQIASEKDKVFNPDLRRFDMALSEFREGNKAEKFLPALVSMAEAKGIKMTSFKQIVLFKKILGIEKNLDKKRLDGEASRLMKDFKGSRLTFEELLRNGKFPKEKLQYYPQTHRYLELITSQDKVSHQEFFDEIEKVIGLTKDKLFANEAERTLDAKSERFLNSKKIITFQATPDDLKKHANEKAATDADIREDGLDNPFSLALRFYDLAQKRDSIFYQKITGDPRLEGDIVVVTGGFHTEGLSQQLKDAGISYMVIRPEIGTEATSDELYFKRLQDNVPLVQTVSPEKNRYAFLDAQFSKGVAALRKSKNITAAETIAIDYGRTDAPDEASTVPVTLGLSEFAAMEPIERQSKVEEVWNSTRTSEPPGARKETKPRRPTVIILIKASVLSRLLKTDEGLTIWQQKVAPDRDNRIGLILDVPDYPDATIGTSARVDRIPGADYDVVANKRYGPAKSSQIVVIANDYDGTLVRKLPEDAVSLLLARPLVEGLLRISIAPEFLERFRAELRRFLEANGLLERAA